MAEHRSRSSRQIWITKGHLAALGVTTFFIAVLAFLVGLQIGKKTSDPANAEAIASAGPTPLVPDVAEEQALEALLREVEYAQATLAPSGELVTEPAGMSAALDVENPGSLQFPDALPQDAAPLATETMAGVQTETSMSPDPTHVVDLPTPSPAGSAPAPESGWAVQIAAYPYSSEADSKVAALRKEGINAYRVAALVDGKTWYRVRVGGYESEEDAAVARNELRVRLGQPELLIASAP
jgi:cell division protein FtsN